MKAYPLADELVRPVLRVRMPRAPRLAALRCLDWNPVRAGLVADPTTYPRVQLRGVRPQYPESPGHLPHRPAAPLPDAPRAVWRVLE